MTKIHALLAIPLAALALAGPAQALDYIYPDGAVTVQAQPGPAPLAVISDQLRNADLQLGNCLRASGGRMSPRCAALRERSRRIADDADARGSRSYISN
jgi:hypothetical protein